MVWKKRAGAELSCYAPKRMTWSALSVCWGLIVLLRLTTPDVHVVEINR